MFKRKHLIIGTAGLLMASGVALAALGPSIGIKVPPELNLLGSITHIGNNNNAINRENKSILNGMSGIALLADKTTQIDGALHRIHSTFPNQTVDLQSLEHLSQEEVMLSRQLHDYAQSLNASLTAIRATSVSQNDDVFKLYSTADTLKHLAASLLQTNQSVQKKLAAAVTKTSQVDSEIP